MGLLLGMIKPGILMSQDKEIRIACIGNSITVGARLQSPLTDAYPSVLQGFLAADTTHRYVVKNFGIGGATLLRFGTPNVWRVLDSLKNFLPDIVVIETGTNETVGATRYNWEHIAELEKDYADYIAALRRIQPTIKIVVCSPLDMVIQTEGLSKEREENLIERRPRIWELRKRHKAIARTHQTYFLDLTKPFKGRADLMTATDGVHPNKAGYAHLASVVHRFLSQRVLVR